MRRLEPVSNLSIQRENVRLLNSINGKRRITVQGRNLFRVAAEIYVTNSKPRILEQGIQVPSGSNGTC